MLLEIFLLVLIVIVIAVVAIWKAYQNKVDYDPVKGSSAQNIYILTTQLVNPQYLDEATFIESFGELLNNKFPDLSQKIYNKHISQLYQCVINHEYAMRLLWSSTWKLDVNVRAQLFAKAINLANHIDASKYFIAGLKVNDQNITKLYQDILQTLQINSDQVLQALDALSKKNPPQAPQQAQQVAA